MVEKKKPVKEDPKPRLKIGKFVVPNKKTPYPQVPYLE